MDFLLNYSIYFMIYGFLGWIVEVIYTGYMSKHFVNRGFLFSPFLPLYAFGAIFVILCTSNFIDNIILLFIVGMISTTIIEYVAALMLENIFHVKWWDYSNYKINFQGRVCLRNSILFGLLSTFVMLIIQPSIATFVSGIDPLIKRELVDTFFIILIIDLFFTLRKLNSFSVRNMASVSGKNKNKEAQLPDLFNGKYTGDRISDFGLNVLLGISVTIGIITMFLINIYFGLVITLIILIILYGTFKNSWTHK